MSTMNSMLDNLCEEIINVIHETFTKLSKFVKSNSFVKISQSKKGDIYLIVGKQAGT